MDSQKVQKSNLKIWGSPCKYYQEAYHFFEAIGGVLFIFWNKARGKQFYFERGIIVSKYTISNGSFNYTMQM